MTTTSATHPPQPASSGTASTGPRADRRAELGFGTRRSLRRPGRLIAVLTACLLILAACSSDDEAEADRSTDDALAYAEGDADETVATDDDEAGDDGDDSDDDGDGATPTTAAPSSTPTTAGSGLPPVTTIPGGGGGDPQGLYRGILGTLWPDIEVVEPVGDPPADRSDVQPLTGLPGAVPARPAALVKIDNGSAALPQTGIDSADIVYEEEVEGGVTRLAAVFHSTSAIVGPVRSGRTTDVGVLGGLGSPLFLYSGANDVTEGIIRAQPFIRNRNFGTSSGYWRDDSRRAPSNLMTDTEPHWASADPVNPPTQFHYRADGAAAEGSPVGAITVDHGSTVAQWDWDGTRWLRTQNGTEHRMADGTRLAVDNVVVVEVVRIDTGLVDASGGEVPEFVFVGTGPVTVYTDGKSVSGTWTRPTLNSVATLVDGSEEPIRLTPGRTWVQIVEDGAGIVSTSAG